MAGKEDRRPPRRLSLKASFSSDNHSNWKDKLRDSCYKRVQEDRARLLWKLRLPESKDKCFSEKEFIRTTFQNIVADEFRKIKDLSMDEHYGALNSTSNVDDALWEYNGLQTAYQGDCEEILLEMQRIFYEDLKKGPTTRGKSEPETNIRTWEDEEDEYLACAVFEHMKLNDHQVTLDVLKTRLAEAYAEHLDRGCRLKPKFCMKSSFDLTVLYIECQGCDTLEVVI
ncbi:unnamed protein product [Thlaspi arvense]|uniref:RPA-interacting protein n=1 Tax=Thlaspi arvense TaxID=13288 RepID=A0AAU9RJH2_THLAR|nr:unnamed protein product [Thlaspi arvense]